MAISISPDYPVADEAVTLSGTTVERRVFELTSVPDESAFETGLLLAGVPENVTPPTSPQRAIELVYEADQFTPDEPGEYGITAHLFREVFGSPAFERDPAGESRVEFVSTETATVEVGALVYLPIVTENGDGGTLRWQVNSGTIRAASIVEPTAEVGRVATLDATVVSALASLVGDAVTGAGTVLQTGVDDLLSNYTAHCALGPGHVHLVDDTTYVVTYGGTDSQEGAIIVLNDLRGKIVGHLTDGSAAAPWHTEVDLKNIPVAPSAHDMASATVLSADLRERAYERHRILIANPACHAPADNGNALTAPTDLDDVIVAYLDAIVAAAPAMPVGECQGAVEAAHYYGFAVAE